MALRLESDPCGDSDGGVGGVTAFTVGWKHTFLVVGDEQGRTPTSFGFTPTTIMTAGTLYTAGQIADATDDSDKSTTDSPTPAA